MFYDDSNPRELAEMLLERFRLFVTCKGEVRACKEGVIVFEQNLEKLVQLLRNRD